MTPVPERNDEDGVAGAAPAAAAPGSGETPGVGTGAGAVMEATCAAPCFCAWSLTIELALVWAFERSLRACQSPWG